MKVLGVGIALIGGIVVGTVIDFILKNRKDVPAKKKQDTDVGMLSGIVTDIAKDEESGFTKITVKDERGDLHYGFSSIPADDLKHIYLGKGWVQVPVLRKG